MEHSPAEYLIKYLCSRPGITVDEVRSYLGRAAIVMMPTETYVDEIYADIQGKLPVNYTPGDPTHRPSMKFLKEHRIRGMWHPTRSVHEALDLFKNGPLRERVESLILTKVPDYEISEILTFCDGVNVMPSSIAEFRHYFWNVDLLTFDDWTYYLTQPTKKVIKLTALTSPRNNDGVRLTLYKMGIMPRGLDKAEIFRSMRDVGYMNFLEANGFNQGEHKAVMLSSYASIVKGSQDKLDEYEAGEQDTINEFYKSVEVSSRANKHKGLSELRGEVDEQGIQRPIRKLPSGSEQE
jgi:hypothetical protein